MLGQDARGQGRRLANENFSENFYCNILPIKDLLIYPPHARKKAFFCEKKLAFGAKTWYNIH